MTFDYREYVKGFGGEIKFNHEKYVIVEYDGFEFKLYKKFIRKNKVKPELRYAVDKVKYFRHIISSEKHPNLSFDKYVFNGMKNKSTVMCLEHGEFEADAYRLLYLKSGCSKCYDKYKKPYAKRMSTSDFIFKSKERFDNKFDYSNTIYNGMRERLTLICRKHGQFEQTPYEHLKSVTGCTHCGRELSAGYSASEYKKKAKNGSHLYIFKFNDGLSDFYKIGISKHPERRLKELKRDGDLEFLEGNSYFFENSEEAWYIEKDVHQMLGFYKYQPVNNFGGFTECFKSVNIDHVYDYLNFVVYGVRSD